MKIDKDVPFYANPDDTHCFQAALKMIMKYFWPDKDFSWKKLEKITAKVEGLWTWPTAGLIWLRERGFEIKNIEPFDYKKFIRFGSRYLLKKYGEEVGKAQIKHSDIEQERILAQKFIKMIDTQKSIPKLDDIKNLLSEGYLIIVNINSEVLDKNTGYSGHFVVVKGFNDKQFFLHDPGSPGIENRKVNFRLFEKAWAYPNEEAKNIIAFKLKEK